MLWSHNHVHFRAQPSIIDYAYMCMYSATSFSGFPLQIHRFHGNTRSRLHCPGIEMKCALIHALGLHATVGRLVDGDFQCDACRIRPPPRRTHSNSEESSAAAATASISRSCSLILRSRKSCNEVILRFQTQHRNPRYG